MPVLLDDLRALKLDDPVMVSPDAGGVERARAYAKRLDASWRSSTSAASAPTSPR
jgi:ribose-phosphate pyrophosphokinase